MNNLPQDLVQIKQILGLKQQNLKGEQLKDLLLKRVKRLENMTVRSQYGSGILDELINVIELKTFKQGEFLYHYKDQCDHVYILLDGEVLVWEKKESPEFEAEKTLLKNINEFRYKAKKCDNLYEEEYYLTKIEEFQEKLNKLRNVDYDNMLKEHENCEEFQYFYLPTVCNFKCIQKMETGGFIGEFESVSKLKFEKTFMVYSENCVALKISTSEFSRIFDLQVKKVQFIQNMLKTNFPQADQFCLELLSFYAEDECFNPGETIFEENDKINKFYIIREGSVTLSKEILYNSSNNNNENNIQKQLLKQKQLEIKQITDRNFFGFENILSTNKKKNKRIYKAVATAHPMTRTFSISKKLINKIIFDNQDFLLEKNFQQLSDVKLQWIQERIEKLVDFQAQQISQNNMRKQDLLMMKNSNQNMVWEKFIGSYINTTKTDISERKASSSMQSFPESMGNLTNTNNNNQKKKGGLDCIEDVFGDSSEDGSFEQMKRKSQSQQQIISNFKEQDPYVMTNYIRNKKKNKSIKISQPKKIKNQLQRVKTVETYTNFSGNLLDSPYNNNYNNKEAEFGRTSIENTFVEDNSMQQQRRSQGNFIQRKAVKSSTFIGNTNTNSNFNSNNPSPPDKKKSIFANHKSSCNLDLESGTVGGFKLENCQNNQRKFGSTQDIYSYSTQQQRQTGNTSISPVKERQVEYIDEQKECSNRIKDFYKLQLSTQGLDKKKKQKNDQQQQEQQQQQYQLNKKLPYQLQQQQNSQTKNYISSERDMLKEFTRESQRGEGQIVNYMNLINDMVKVQDEYKRKVSHEIMGFSMINTGQETPKSSSSIQFQSKLANNTQNSTQNQNQRSSVPKIYPVQQKKQLCLTSLAGNLKKKYDEKQMKRYSIQQKNRYQSQGMIIKNLENKANLTPQNAKSMRSMVNGGYSSDMNINSTNFQSNSNSFNSSAISSNYSNSPQKQPSIKVARSQLRKSTFCKQQSDQGTNNPEESPEQNTQNPNQNIIINNNNIQQGLNTNKESSKSYQFYQQNNNNKNKNSGYSLRKFSLKKCQSRLEEVGQEVFLQSNKSRQSGSTFKVKTYASESDRGDESGTFLQKRQKQKYLDDLLQPTSFKQISQINTPKN